MRDMGLGDFVQIGRAGLFQKRRRIEYLSKKLWEYGAIFKQNSMRCETTKYVAQLLCNCSSIF